MRDIVLSSGIAPEKVFLIPIGINLSYFRMQTPESRKKTRLKYGIPESAVVIGSFQKDGVGWDEGLEPKLIKGPDVFLKTIEILKPRIPELFVLLSGPARGFVKQGLERLGVPYCHCFLERYPEIGQLFQAWDIQSPQAQKIYLTGGVCCVLGFLWFTSLLPVCGMYHIIWGAFILHNPVYRRRFKKYFLLTLPFVGCYLLYYAVFLGWPAYVVYSGQVSKPFGQLHQYFLRANRTHLNTASLIANLRTLNWYVLPFVSWILLEVGLIYQARYYPRIFLILLGYGTLWSFYFLGDTPQHFLAYFCWLRGCKNSFWANPSRL